MLKRLLVHKTRERKKIAHRDLRRRFASFALSLGLAFTGSSGAIFAQGKRQDQRREAHKRRPEKERHARKSGRWNSLSSPRERAESEREPKTRKRGLVNSLSSSPEREHEARKRGLVNSLSSSKARAESERGREDRKRR